MSQYKIGSATFTNGSADIVGVGTTWLTNLSVGDYFVRVGDNVSYEVGSVNSDASISLTSNYAGVTGSALSYVAHKDFHPNGAPKWSNADVEFAAIQNRWNQKWPVNSFGTAASLDSGTGIGQVPTNGDLPTFGTAAEVDTGAGANQVPTNADLSEGAFLDAGSNDADLTINSRVIGVNQAWQDLLPSRAADTGYTNSTGKPIEVVISIEAAGADGNVSRGRVTVSGLPIAELACVVSGSDRGYSSISFIVPSGETYQIIDVDGLSIVTWYELR